MESIIKVRSNLSLSNELIVFFPTLCICVLAGEPLSGNCTCHSDMFVKALFAIKREIHPSNERRCLGSQYLYS